MDELHTWYGNQNILEMCLPSNQTSVTLGAQDNVSDSPKASSPEYW